MKGHDPATEPLERLFVSQLPVIDRICALVARRHALSASDAEELTAWVHERLIDGDYAILRKFGGRSSLSTYLSVAIANLFRDFRNHKWGRWRPSAVAERLGPIAVRLEQLITRDGCSAREAVSIVMSAGVELSDGELTRLAARLPSRTREREVPVDGLDILDPASHADGATSEEERDSIVRALTTAVASLSDEDRIITRMRFWEEMTIADIARLLRLEQKPLYRRIETIGRHLRGTLEQMGVTDERARELLGKEGLW